MSHLPGWWSWCPSHTKVFAFGMDLDTSGHIPNLSGTDFLDFGSHLCTHPKFAWAVQPQVSRLWITSDHIFPHLRGPIDSRYLYFGSHVGYYPLK